MIIALALGVSARAEKWSMAYATVTSSESTISVAVAHRAAYLTYPCMTADRVHLTHPRFITLGYFEPRWLHTPVWHDPEYNGEEWNGIHAVPVDRVNYLECQLSLDCRVAFHRRRQSEETV